MTEDTQNQEDFKPNVLIDGVQVFAEDLSPNGRVLMARLQRLNAKKATAVADIEEIIGSILHFENLLIADYQSMMDGVSVEEEVESEEDTDESDS
tara:strand:- start:1393 stop:1677 length:285 start_codon:yes stop_codon:yes gene_type:complete